VSPSSLEPSADRPRGWLRERYFGFDDFNCLRAYAREQVADKVLCGFVRDRAHSHRGKILLKQMRVACTAANEFVLDPPDRDQSTSKRARTTTNIRQVSPLFAPVTPRPRTARAGRCRGRRGVFWHLAASVRQRAFNGSTVRLFLSPIASSPSSRETPSPFG
jgi:hypothetical protein